MDWEIYDVGCAAGNKYKEEFDDTDKYNQDAEMISADNYTAYVFNLVQNIMVFKAQRQAQIMYLTRMILLLHGCMRKSVLLWIKWYCCI